jgi:t-SNARE complex subunit (syntaxin)
MILTLDSPLQLQTNGYRSQAARGALREAQNRAAELARIEQTLIELAQLFSDVRPFLSPSSSLQY